MDCIYCKCFLSYPEGAQFIACPACTQMMQPKAPDLNYMSCEGRCGTQLSYTLEMIVIECPNCLARMRTPKFNLREGSEKEDMAVAMAKGNSPTHPRDGNPHSAAIKTDVPGNGKWTTMTRSGGMSGADTQQWDPATAVSSSKKKKTKDGTEPKAASNAYMFFCKDNREKMALEAPQLEFGLYGSKLGALWRALSKEEKAPYEQMAREDKIRYNKDKGNTATPNAPASSTGGPMADEDEDTVSASSSSLSLSSSSSSLTGAADASDPSTSSSEDVLSAAASPLSGAGAGVGEQAAGDTGGGRGGRGGGRSRSSSIEEGGAEEPHSKKQKK